MAGRKGITMITFHEKVISLRPGSLTASGIKVLQVNLGYQCNMSCRHCHVSAGPGRSETMSETTVDAVLCVLKENPIETLDITGGAPEMNKHFRRLVSEGKKAGKRVLVRTNLTIFYEPGMADLPEFYRDQQVELIASLPCYLEENVNAIRGSGAFQKSIDAIRALNKLGFGDGENSLSLSLVYNPTGAYLAPPQHALEADYKRELKDRHGIAFTRLYAFTNMPLGRFHDTLETRGDLGKYLDLLPSAFNPATLPHLMCCSFVNVAWDGKLYDCDFNQVLGMPVTEKRIRHIGDFDYAVLSHRTIAVGDHCFACTAGQGSTCVGAAT